MVRRRIPHFLIALMVLSAWVPASAQSSGKTASLTAVAASAAAEPAAVAVIPKNPTDLMVLAAKTNGLAGLNNRPWHVKLMYQTFDADGKPGHIGVLEEWWESAKKYKYIYTAPGFQQTTYRDGKAEVTTGDQGWPAIKILADRVEGFLWTPLPSANMAANPTYRVQQRKMGPVELTCLQPVAISQLLSEDAVTLMAKGADWVPTTCFSDGSAAARVVILHDGEIAVLNNIVEFDGHYIAKQIALNDMNLPEVYLTVMQLDFPASIPNADLAPPIETPASAVAAPPMVNAGVMARRRIRGDRVQYPQSAKAQRISGYVLLTLDIGEEGNVAGLKCVIGPKVLRDAAMDAVKTWKYRPYELNGKPVEVETQINVIFTLGR
jgi:TonB family protein